MDSSNSEVPEKGEEKKEGKENNITPPSSGTPSRTPSNGSLVGGSLDLSVDEESTKQINQISRPSALRISSRQSSASSPSSKEAGRPPLPPSFNLSSPLSQQHDEVADKHGRKESTGDYSFMSALTDSSPEEIRPSHQRRVSWDEAAMEQKPPAVLHPAELGKVLSFTDLQAAGPLESEAETTLLQVLEAREGDTVDRDVGKHILSQVPDEALDAFRETLPAENLSKSNTSGERTEADEPPLLQTTPNVSRRSMERLSSTSASRTTRNTLASSGSQKKGHRRDKTGVPPEGSPRPRTATLEAKLLGLTNAMHDIHEQSADEDVKDKPAHYRNPSNQTDISPDAGAFLKDANVLFRPLVPKEKGERNLAADRRASLTGMFSARWNASVSGNSNPEETEGDRLVDIGEELEPEGDGSDPELGENNHADESNGNGTGLRHQEKAGRRGFRRFFTRTADKAKEDWTTFSDFLRPRKASIATRIKITTLLVFIPLVGASAILFYPYEYDCGDEPCTENTPPTLAREGAGGAYTSWFLLFIVRQVITLGLAMAGQAFFIDFLSLRCRWTVRVFGPVQTLILVQSKGFPFIISAWSFFSLLLSSGAHKFAKHWLYWQPVKMFNESNKAGTITESKMNFAILFCGLAFGIVVTAKRAILGMHFGKKTYLNYGEQLAKVVNKMLLISETAKLGHTFERGVTKSEIGSRDRETLMTLIHGSTQSGDISATGFESSGTSNSKQKVIDEERIDLLNLSQKNKVMRMLEDWEEPETASQKPNDASINAVLQFRQALMLTAGEYPFSLSFGLANTREACIESAQKVYMSLLLNQPEQDVLHFDTIALLATTTDGDIDEQKMKDLVRLFRPDREGNLTLIDFVKSVDSVYKRLRLLRASIENAGQIDKGAEKIFNWAFYSVLVIIFLSIVNLDPLALFISFSSIIVAFAFMIGSASAKYFEGLLFILVRHPYDIGDRIHVSPVDQDTNSNGSSTWFVENAGLFTTTIRFATTNEVATVSNGSLANSRVINGARSPKMLAYVYMKFGVDVPYTKVQLFRKTVEEFARKRPRDWTSMCGFRATRVESEQGFIEYVIVLEHRDRWQNVVTMLNAKAEISSFCLEVAKKLNMRYTMPSVPVNLSMAGPNASRMADEVTAHIDAEDGERTRHRTQATSLGMEDLAALFGDTAS